MKHFLRSKRLNYETDPFAFKHETTSNQKGKKEKMIVKWMKLLACALCVSLLLGVVGCKDDDDGGGESSGNGSTGLGGNWRVGVTSEEITDNPLGVLYVTEVGKVWNWSITELYDGSFTSQISRGSITGTASGTPSAFTGSVQEGHTTAVISGRFSASGNTGKGSYNYNYYSSGGTYLGAGIVQFTMQRL